MWLQAVGALSILRGMFGIGPWEWFIVLVLALVVVGPRRLPEVARTLGRVVTEVRRTTFDLRRTLEDELETEERERRRAEARERRRLHDEEMARSGQTVPTPTVAPRAPAQPEEDLGVSQQVMESDAVVDDDETTISSGAGAEDGKSAGDEQTDQGDSA
ncbi:MAG: twin-arginine translocase subunit TatB [Deltaproteobacteria bacterium]|nr:twin-arginine translocase subunit TatB [Deltaproteobacteria bacterium]